MSFSIENIGNSSSESIRHPFISPLLQFHGRVLQTFDTLPESGQLVEVGKRVGVVAIALFAYVILGTLALVGIALEKCQKSVQVEIEDLSAVGQETEESEEVPLFEIVTPYFYGSSEILIQGELFARISFGELRVSGIEMFLRKGDVWGECGGLKTGNITVPHGEATMNSTLGVLECTYAHGSVEGFAKFTLVDGTTFVGNMKGGHLEGFGTLTLSNGDVYEGEWVNGKLDLTTENTESTEKG